MKQNRELLDARYRLTHIVLLHGTTACEKRSKKLGNFFYARYRLIHIVLLHGTIPCEM